MKQTEARKIITEFENGLKYGFEITEEIDDMDNIQIWMKLKDKQEILFVAKIIKDFGGRCIIITAYKNEEYHNLVYHFDIDGIVINVEIELINDVVDSITPILKSADWAEREIKEMQGIELLNHPNPKRLFLDESIDEGILDEYIPLSSAMRGAATNSMWERVNRQRQKDEL
jgi:Ni,Fe-hydrogenase III component G